MSKKPKKQGNGFALLVMIFAVFMANQSGVLAKAHLNIPRVHLGHSGVSGAAIYKAVSYARAQLGCPYLYGGTGPCSTGYDCSGLIQMAYRSAGVSIPRTSEDQWRVLRHDHAAHVGDLVFFTGSPIDPPPGHVGLVIGSGKMIEAYGSGVPIRIASYGDRSPWGFAIP